jgi:hypothetical protein
LEVTVGLSKPWRNFVGKMLLSIQASQDVKLGNRRRSISITAHCKERLNSVIGALACSTSTARDRPAFNNIC